MKHRSTGGNIAWDTARQHGQPIRTLGTLMHANFSMNGENKKIQRVLSV